MLLKMKIINLSIGLCFVLLVGCITSKHTPVPIFQTPIDNKVELERIVQRLNEEGIKITVTKDGFIYVADEFTARRMRTIIYAEDLVPSNFEYQSDLLFGEKWVVTDFERLVMFQRALRRKVIERIKAIDDIADVEMIIGWPKIELFRSDQDQIFAIAIITPRVRSGISLSQDRIEEIQNIIKFTISKEDEYAQRYFGSLYDDIRNDNIVIIVNYGIHFQKITGFHNRHE